MAYWHEIINFDINIIIPAFSFCHIILSVKKWENRNLIYLFHLAFVCTVNVKIKFSKILQNSLNMIFHCLTSILSCYFISQWLFSVAFL